MNLLGRIERYLQRSATSATQFGRRALRDPKFVEDLRNGREPRARTLARVGAFLDRAEAASGSEPCAR